MEEAVESEVTLWIIFWMRVEMEDFNVGEESGQVKNNEKTMFKGCLDHFG